MFNADIDALVRETFEKSTDLAGLSPYRDFNFGDEGQLQVVKPDQVPGVLYNLEIKASTFVIRIHATENLAEDYDKILSNPENYPSLRLVDGEAGVPQKLKFFECDTAVLAKHIKLELGNKRFPIYEENILNISDPGDSWWIACQKSELKIFFKLARTENIDSMIKLGPLGDSQNAMEMFNQMHGYFQMLFPVADYSSAHGQLAIKCDQAENMIFDAFSRILTEGDAGHEFWDYLRNLEMNSEDRPYLESLKKANYFLMQIATMRSFWIGIQAELES